MFLHLSMILHIFFLCEHVKSGTLDKLVAGKDYDKDLRPLFGVRQLNISSRMIISTFGPINEQDMTFKLSFYYRQRWNDPRLAHNGTFEQITSNFHPRGTIWLPDTYIVNIHDVKYYDDFTRTVIKRNGEVIFSYKVSATCTCNMDLRTYPFDKQTCHVQLESYAFNKTEVLLSWSDFKLDVPKNEKLSLTGYEVLDIWKTTKDSEYGGVDSDRFSNLLLHVKVKRTSVYYAYKAFLPTLFLTIFNLGSYYIPDDAMPARVTLIITTFLANMLILQSISDQTVQVSYTTAMQLFLLVNILFLMTSILQYLVLLHVKKIASLKEHLKKSFMTHRSSTMEENTTSRETGRGVIHLNDHFRTNKDESDTNNETEQNIENPTVAPAASAFKAKNEWKKLERAIQFITPTTKKPKTHILDRIFRILMPSLYLLFCAVYFGYYFS